MRFEEYAAGLAFRDIGPDDPRIHRPTDGTAVHRLASPRLNAIFEVENTILPGDSDDMLARLSPLLSMPRMSTLAIGALLNQAVAEMPSDHCYVNVGVWHGFSLFAAAAGNDDKRCIGVDNFSEFGRAQQNFTRRFKQRRSNGLEFYAVDYREYFATYHRGEIGVYFYDGHHAYEHQLRGLQVAEPFFASGCLIFVDDTNFDAPRQATNDFLSASEHRYHCVMDRGTISAGHPTLWNGIIVLRRA